MPLAAVLPSLSAVMRAAVHEHRSAAMGRALHRTTHQVPTRYPKPQTPHPKPQTPKSDSNTDPFGAAAQRDVRRAPVSSEGGAASPPPREVGRTTRGCPLNRPDSI